MTPLVVALLAIQGTGLPRPIELTARNGWSIYLTFWTPTSVEVEANPPRLPSVGHSHWLSHSPLSLHRGLDFSTVGQPSVARPVVTGSSNVTVKCGRLKVEFAKATGSLSFYLDGRLVTKETGRTANGSALTGRFALRPDEALYGLGQHQTGLLDERGTTVTLMQRNRDVAVPVLMSSKGYGVFWDNASITKVALGAKASPQMATWTSEVAPTERYFVLAGPDIPSAIKDYRAITGAAPMFPRWAWGFWQCKEHYSSSQELLDVVSWYRLNHVPLDAIIQDWQYWRPGQWGSHQFDPTRYPDPKALVKKLHDEKAHIIISVWAKFDSTTANYKELANSEVLYDLSGNGDMGAREKYYDPFDPVGRKLYWSQISKDLFSLGLDGWWLDATEPELNGRWGEFRGVRTAAGWGATVYNAFPLMTTSAVFKGQRAQNSSKRVFILTRSAFAGQQRNSAVTWSGDIQGDWQTFRKQIPAGLNFAMSGIPYWNTDIGGFFGGNPKDPAYSELFTRWFQFGAFCPMFRVHGTNYPKEMYRFEPNIKQILINYDKLRYSLIPYIYSTSADVTFNGGSMISALPVNFGRDKKTWKIRDEFTFGKDLLVAPVIHSSIPDAVSIPSSVLLDEQGQPGGLTGKYFKGRSFNTLVDKRKDSAIAFDLAPGSAALRRAWGISALGATDFSAEWSGFLKVPKTGNYTLTLGADDGMRLTLGGRVVIDDWTTRPYESRSVSVRLEAGKPMPIGISYFQAGGGASIQLGWNPPMQKPATAGRYVYLPAGARWIDYWTGKSYAGGTNLYVQTPLWKLPLFVRAGSVIPIGAVGSTTLDIDKEPITLQVFPGSDGNGSLYQDANDGYAYENGHYSVIKFHWNQTAQTLTLGALTGKDGPYRSRTLRIQIMGRKNPSKAPQALDHLKVVASRTIRYSGSRQVVRF